MPVSSSVAHVSNLVALSLVLSVCRPADPPANAGGTDSQSYVIAGDAAGAPLTCGGADITAHLSAWFLALGRGDGRSAAAFFGIERPDVPFAWMSFTDTASATRFAVRTSADSLAHRFATMDVANIELRGMDLVGWVPERESVAFLLFFEYSAAEKPRQGDAPERRYGFGKAEYHCPSETFLVMSIGRMPEAAWRELYAAHLRGA